MRVEGKGIVAPEPVTISIGQEQSALIWTGSRRIDKARGWSGDTTYIGKLGEKAFAIYMDHFGFQLDVDLEIYDSGDGGWDFVIAGKTVDVKTRSLGQLNLVKRIDQEGNILPLKADYYVFAERIARKIGLVRETVRLLGFESRDGIVEASERSRSRFGHDNLAIDDVDLQPIRRLAVMLEAKANG